MNKNLLKKEIKFRIRGALPKNVIIKWKSDKFKEEKATALSRGQKHAISPDKIKVYPGGSYKKAASFLSHTKIDSDGYYFYSIDTYSYLLGDKDYLDNLSPNYSMFFKPLTQIRQDYKFCNVFINALEEHIDRSINHLEASNSKNPRTKVQINYLSRIKDHEVKSFDEALQRILFFNSLVWQTGHRLVGLGPLDQMLDSYYQEDLKAKRETRSSVKRKIKEFCKILHNYYSYKSNVLLGDTGQIIQLSGYYQKNKTFISDLDYIFIESVKELQLPDPKILLRITKDTPRDLYELSLESIETGIGCPLFANDDAIIPALTSLRYSEKEALNYSTSACWEPMVYGKSADQNNLENYIPIDTLNRLLSEGGKYATYADFLSTFEEKEKEDLEIILKTLNYKRFNVDPLLTIMTADCKKIQRDITKGGARYFNYGILTVSFANFINSMFVIKKYVFDEKKYTISQLNELRIKEKFDNLQPDKVFGEDDAEVIDLVNRVMRVASEFFVNKKNHYGGDYNIGFSSPSYIDKAKDSEASLDGRKKGEPFSVHISSSASLAYTELLNFAGKLNYKENRFNGNVVDFIVSKDFLSNNFSKFVDFLEMSRKVGYFEMQMNVTSSDILIKAKENPEKFPNLIVRVWGFSSYFNDLPEEYKDLLISRALKSEGKC